MKFLLSIIFLFALTGAISAQTILVNPTGVNVNSQNATTVFLTFGQIPANYVPAEAIWCGELVPAAPPALGFQCRADTIYGSLPARYNRSQASGSGGFTDIMAIPPSVVRRAYQAAVRGANAGFFYVRRFISTNGLPDQFVNVTCRMTGGGARVPFALMNVEIKTLSKEPVLFINSGDKFPEVIAEIQYNGTGRLKGRWEIVQPGEEPPKNEDLLTEATLPVEQRGTQRRYTQIERFSHFLPPVGKFLLKLEAPERAPISAEGQYILLLRIEASDDKESDSNLAILGVGGGTVHSGAVASFPMPTLKFFVTGTTAKFVRGKTLTTDSTEILSFKPDEPIVFGWKEFSGAFIYRVEILDGQTNPILSAVLVSPVTSYRAPSWFRTRFGERKNLTWRVTAIDENGKIISQSRAGKLVLEK